MRIPSGGSEGGERNGRKWGGGKGEESVVRERRIYKEEEEPAKRHKQGQRERQREPGKTHSNQ